VRRNGTKIRHLLAAVLSGCFLAACVPIFFGVEGNGARNGAEIRLPPETVLGRLVDLAPRGSVVVLTGIERLGGESDGLAVHVQANLEPKLLEAANERGLKVVDRDRLALVLAEWKLNKIGLTGKDVGAAELLGARYAITGDITIEKDEVHIRLKMLDYTTGEIIGHNEAWQPMALYSNCFDDAAAFAKLRKGQGDGSKSLIKLETDGEEFKIGGTINLSFSVDGPGYVTIVDVNPSGEKMVLFPNAYQENNYCVPGTRYTVPPDNGAFDLEVKGPPGNDRIMAILSDQPDLPMRIAKMTTGDFTTKVVTISRARAVVPVRIVR